VPEYVARYLDENYLLFQCFVPFVDDQFQYKGKRCQVYLCEAYVNTDDIYIYIYIIYCLYSYVR
jgi:hypothetical protein